MSQMVFVIKLGLDPLKLTCLVHLGSCGMLEFLGSISVFGWTLIALVVFVVFKIPSFLGGKGRIKSEQDPTTIGKAPPDNYFTDLNN